MGAPYIYDISRLRVKDLHSATYIYVIRRLRVNQNKVTSLPKDSRIMSAGQQILGDTKHS